MIPIIALIGRTNVGKSTLFNILTKTRDALVSDDPNLTRDRNYGSFYLQNKKIIIIDTAGFDFESTVIKKRTHKQTLVAIKECNLIFFVVSARDGLINHEYDIAKKIRKYNKKIILIINKIDGIKDDTKINEFYTLGFKNNINISASHNQGINKLFIQYLIPWIQLKFANWKVKEENIINSKKNNTTIKIVCIGKPNSGKSTLINSFLKKERMITSPIPGTTLDNISVLIKHQQKNYFLTDTAGISKKKKNIRIEQYSIIKTFRNIEKSDVSLLIIDASINISNQDLVLINFVETCGKPLIIVINKWDLLNNMEKKTLKTTIKQKLKNYIFSKIFFISALYKKNLSHIFLSIDNIYQKFNRKITTSKITKILYLAIKKNKIPMIHGRQIKLKYAHLGNSNPLKIIIHGNKIKYLSLSYQKYLKNFFYDALQLHGIPIKIQLKEAKNPYISKNN